MLAWFRDNQRHMLVIFTVLLMGGFGVMGVVSNSTQSGSSQATTEAKPVKEWKLGKVTDQQLWRIHRQRIALAVLQQELQTVVLEKQPNFVPNDSLLMGGPPPTDASEAVVFSRAFQIMLLAQKAEDMGMFVSDAAAEANMLQFTGNWLDSTQLRAIANDVGQRDRLSYESYIQILKREMLASYLVFLGINGGRPVYPSPTQAYQAYKQMNERIECQVLGLPVSDYMNKVTGQPTETEIQALYEKGKYRFPDPANKDPGFKIPNRVKLQYFAADVKTLTDKYKAELTDEVIQAEYDRLVSEKSPLVYDAQLTNLGSENPLELPPMDAPGTEGNGESTEGNTDGLPELPGTENSESAAETQSNGKPATDAPPVPTKGGQENGEADQQSGAALTTVDPVYVTTPQEENGGQEENGQQESGTTETPQTAGDSNSASEATASETTTQESVAQDNPVEDGTETPATEPEQGKVRPLEEVREAIMDRLAQPQAFDEMEKTFKRLKREIGFYQTDLRIYQSAPETEEKPVALNFEAIAQENGLTFRETGSLDEATFSQMQLGMAGGQFGAPYSAVLFGNFEQVKELSPESPTNDVLVWVAEKYPAEIPTLDQVRDEIVDFWKKQEAVKLAIADAEAKAKTVSDSGKLMKETQDAAIQTGGFTWYTMGGFQMGNFQMSAEISQPNGVEMAGPEFMQAAFGLGLNQAGAAMNADRSIAYVIQKTADAGLTEEEMRENFLNATERMGTYPNQVPMVLANENTLVTQQFLKNLNDEYDCHDLR